MEPRFAVSKCPRCDGLTVTVDLAYQKTAMCRRCGKASPVSKWNDVGRYTNREEAAGALPEFEPAAAATAIPDRSKEPKPTRRRRVEELMAAIEGKSWNLAELQRRFEKAGMKSALASLIKEGVIYRTSGDASYAVSAHWRNDLPTTES